MKHRRSAGWLYLSKLAAVKEYAFMKASTHCLLFLVPHLSVLAGQYALIRSQCTPSRPYTTQGSQHPSPSTAIGMPSSCHSYQELSLRVFEKYLIPGLCCQILREGRSCWSVHGCGYLYGICKICRTLFHTCVSQVARLAQCTLLVSRTLVGCTPLYWICGVAFKWQRYHAIACIHRWPHPL